MNIVNYILVNVGEIYLIKMFNKKLRIVFVLILIIFKNDIFLI